MAKRDIENHEEDDAAEDNLEPEDPEEARLRRILDAIHASGAGHVKVRVERFVPGKGKVRLDPLTLTDEQVSEAQEEVARVYGGGEFFIEFRVKGMILGSDHFTVDGEPKKPAAAAQPTEPPATRLDPKVAALEAKLAALEAKERAAEEEATRRKAIEEVTAPLAAQLKTVLAKLESAPAPAPVERESEIERFLRLQKSLAPKTPEGPSPEVQALSKQVEALTKAIAVERKRAEKAEHQRELDALKKELADLKAAATAPRAKDPIDTFEREILRMAKLDKVLGFAKKGEEGNSPLMEGLIARVEKRLSPVLLGLVEEKIVGAIEGGAAAAQISATPPESPAQFAVLLQKEFQTGFVSVGDAAWVAATRARFPRHVAELAAITERDPFCAFLVRLGFPSETVQAAVTPETWAQLRAILETLRVQLAAAPPPPPPAPATAPATPPPGSAVGAAAAVVEDDQGDEGETEFTDEIEDEDDGDEDLDASDEDGDEDDGEDEA